MLSVENMLRRTSVVGAAIALACVHGTGVAQKMYKHVDEKGNVSFSDRPQKAQQKTEKAQAPNVASREATRQLQIESQNSMREEQAQRAAAQRRAAAVAQKERQERATQRQLEEERNPQSAPRSVRIVR